MPDLFSGDAVPEDFLHRPGEYDVMAWLGRHGPETWEPIVDAVVAALKAEGVTWIGTTGYCFGAPPAWRLALSGDAVVVVVQEDRFSKIQHFY